MTSSGAKFSILILANSYCSLQRLIVSEIKSYGLNGEMTLGRLSSKSSSRKDTDRYEREI